MRAKLIRHIYAAIIVLIPFISHSQNQLGLNPPSLKWNQIETPSGKIIFPVGLDSFATRAAGIMNYERVHDSTIAATGNTKLVSAIIQNQSTLPAGFSTPAPWRNEYYITPPQNFFLGPVPWMDGMVAHEYRHTQQFYVGNGGFTLAYKIVMGQTGWLLNTLFTQPLWMREGDAVTAETILTDGGRGRLPSFNMEYRALLLEGYSFSYEKAHYTSFRDFVPNAYRLGYYMTTKARRDYGDDVLQKILADAYNKKGFIYPFSRSMQKFTGMGTRKFYEATVHELDSIFRIKDSRLQLTSSRNVVPDSPSVFTSWRFPQYLADGSVVSLKSSFKEINTYYRISSTGSEEKLFSPGIYTDDHNTTVVEGNLMTWCESSFDARWINRDFSIIKVYDFKTGKTLKLTSRSKYFSPAPSHDGQKIVAVKLDENGKCSLVILDRKTGDEIKSFPNPNNINFSQPRWMDDDTRIVVLALSAKGNGLFIINTENGKTETILDYTNVDISRPFPKGDYVFFSAGYSGIDNIYSIHLNDKKLFQITSVRFGAFEPCVSADGSKLIYAEYSEEGYRLKEVNLVPSLFKPVSNSDSSDLKFHEPLMKSSGNNLSTQSFPSSYPVTKYHSLTNGLFNLYGWFPIPNIPEYGAEFYTQNIMSTLRGTLGILYNTNENNFHSYIKLTYAALYPEVDLQYEYGANRKGKIVDDQSEQIKNVTWSENFLSQGLFLPLRLTQGTHITTLHIGGLYEYYSVTAADTINDVPQSDHFNFSAINAQLKFSRLKIRARRQVEPCWGQTLDFSLQQSFNDDPQRLVGVSTLYFPGVARTHSFNLALSYKKENVTNVYRFKDDFIMPRGYKPTPLDMIYGVAANYELPLLYPDVAAGPVIFLQRLRMNFFYDYSIGKLNGVTSTLNSTGAELFADMRLFRLIQTSMGLRYSYPFNSNFEKTNAVTFLVTRFEIAN